MLETLNDKKLPENPMGTAPVNKIIIQMGWPAMLSMLVNALYNVVDSIFVGMVSEDSIAAISLVTPIQLFIISIAVGSGVGVKSLVSRSLGGKNYDKANQTASTGMFIALFNGLIWIIFTAFFAKDFIHIYYQEGPIAENALIYLQICGYCAVFVNFQIICENMIQATGDMKTAMYIDLAGGITNIVLDPILIFGWVGPALGVMGAAIATVIGEGVAMVLAIIAMFKKMERIKIKVKGYKADWQVIKEIYAVGFPTIIMQASLPILIMLYNQMLAGISSTAVAVLGVFNRLQSFIFMPVFGLMQGTLPLIAYNFGAGDKDRVIAIKNEAFKLAFIFMAIGLLIFQLFPKTLLGFFSAGEDMIAMGVPALRIISLSFLSASYTIVCSNVFQAMGHGIYSLLNSLIRQLVCVLPLAYLLNEIGGVTLSWASFPLAEIFAVLYSFLVFRHLKKKEIDTLVKVQ